MPLIKSLFFQASVSVTLFLATALSQPFHFSGREESMFFLPAGVGLGIAWRYGNKALIGAFVGLFTYYTTLHNLELWVALWTTTTWVFSVYFALWGLKLFIPEVLMKAPLKSLLTFFGFGVVLAPLIHTLLDLPMVIPAGLVDPDQDIRIFLFLYWQGEAFGALLLTPVIFLAGRNFSMLYQGDYAVYPKNGREKILWLSLFGLNILSTFLWGETHLYAGISDQLFILFPLLAWSAYRLGVIFSSIAVFLTCFGIFSFYAFGFGGTPIPVTEQEYIALLTFIITISLLTYSVAVITLERRLETSRLRYAATHDPLSGLLNTRALKDRLESLMKGGAGIKPELGYLEIDQYEEMRRHYGVSGRNMLIKRFGLHLNKILSQSCEIFRIGAGEFAFISKEKGALPRSAHTWLNNPEPYRFEWENKQFSIIPKACLLPVTSHFDSPHHLLELASAHVNRLSKGKRGLISIDPMDDGVLKDREIRAKWMGKLQQALADDQFRLLYQPIVSLNDKQAAVKNNSTMQHVEILLRLIGDDGSLVEPGIFMPYAEAFNLMPDIDRWVVSKALHLIENDPMLRQPETLCAINLSGQSINDMAFPEYILEQLKNTHVDAKKICFEITETVALSDLKQAAHFFSQLREMGCSVALDDFGTGTASFEYLKRLHVDYLKIDGSFIREIEGNKLDYVIVTAIQDVARTTGAKTIAEYVETDGVLDLLIKLGIDYGQGYIFGRPEEITKSD
ncbi:EAL domain-containing protein [endosymbiont of Lamellibrachia barhami]|uniref:EAL domain-containing protein n=1 Tax=endosymbiont of Lamellibrachia barhami TaxID=205975 RepID=UPI0015B178C4|nr:EAL domain-containing protein [endosymbiont of Lamellibrachia barhami]